MALPFGAYFPARLLQIARHIEGHQQNHDQKTFPPGTVRPKCEDCPSLIEEDRIRWFARHHPGMTPRTCSKCSFARKAKRSQQAR